LKTTKGYLIEDTFIRKGAEIQLPLDESFAGGSSASVAQKLVNVLGRKIGWSFDFSDVPWDYANSYGSFKGYYAFSNTGVLLKINFSLGSSDSIVSFDVYLDGPDIAPSYTVETDGLNIIEIVNLIAESLVEDGEVGEGALEESVLKEKGAITSEDTLLPVIDRWVKENREIIKELQKDPVPEIYQGIWSAWVSDKPNYQVPFYLFSKALKTYLIKNGLSNRTYRKRKNGSKERAVVDPVLEASFENVLEAMGWVEKFEILKGAIEAVVDGDIQSLYLFGEPGSGKSFTTVETLDALGVKYNLYKGGVKGMDELLRILYNHRENELLVFDDFDSVLKQKDSANIFKAALENSPIREITYVDVGRKGGMKDVPQRFNFSSGIIFISNERKLNSAIASRSITLEVSLSNSEVIDKINNSLSEYRPEVPMKQKKEALEYLQEISAGVKTVDYRTLDKVLVAMKIQPSNWKRTALMFIKALD
jgi:hypothetical protein